MCYQFTTDSMLQGGGHIQEHSTVMIPQVLKNMFSGALLPVDMRWGAGAKRKEHVWTG